jgi:transposase
MLALHRVRSLLIRERTALMNQMRGLLAEFGIVVAQGPADCGGHWRSSRSSVTTG